MIARSVKSEGYPISCQTHIGEGMGVLVKGGTLAPCEFRNVESDNAAIKLGPGNRFSSNLDCCKGCGICVAESLFGAIEMVPEET